MYTRGERLGRRWAADRVTPKCELKGESCKKASEKEELMDHILVTEVLSDQVVSAGRNDLLA